MRRLLVPAAVLAALAAAPQAPAATKVVAITGSGFSPATVSITAEDTVVWRNRDTRNHQVVSTTGAFASPVLRPGRSYRFRFPVAGRFAYRDALHPSRRGVVRVAGLPPALTLAASSPQVAFGRPVTLSGAVTSRRAGEQVTITAQPWGQPSPVVLATVVTGDGGGFAHVTKPQLLTTYAASWKGAASQPVGVAVAPVITFGRSNGWLVRVWAGRTMERKAVHVQRRSRFGQWVTIRRVVLGPGSRARFRLPLPEGPHRLRIAMSVNQAGAGYLAAFSGEVRWRQR